MRTILKIWMAILAISILWATDASAQLTSKQWIGASGGNATKWFRAQNWSPSGVPTANDSCRISAPGLIGNRVGPTLEATGAVCGKLRVDQTATLTTASFKITVADSTGGGVVLVPDSVASGVIVFRGGRIIGEIERTIAASDTGIYRFTDAQTYIKPSGTQGRRTVRVKSLPDSSAPSPNPDSAIKRYYTINDSGSGGALAGTLRLAYDSAEVRATDTSEGSFTLWRQVGGIWVDQGATARSGAANPRWVELTGVLTFSNWTISRAGSGLPIQLASFSAAVIRDNDIEVSWRTVTETNNYGFEVYRKRGESADWTTEGSPWRKIAFIEGHGTTLAPQSYSYVDRGVPFGLYYYRIKQIDLGGKSETFPEIAVNVGAGPDKFVLAQNYPNPFNPSTLIDFVVPQSGFATMKVYNVLGQEVASLFEGNVDGGKIYTARFDASKLPSGLYFYTLRSAGKTETKRMVLMK